MKPKIKFGTLDIVLCLLLIIAVGVNIWAYAKPKTGDDEQDRAAATSNAAARQEETPIPVRETVISMPHEVDGDEGLYTGEIEGGAPEGYGEFIANIDAGWSYEGAWRDGLMHGEGVMTHPNSVFQGTFAEGKMNGEFEVYAGETLRYRGGIQDGKLNGYGALYTATGTLMYEGSFVDDMLNESAAGRAARGEAFAAGCLDMSPDLYYSVLAAGDMAPDTWVHVWGSPIGLSEQGASGTIVIAHMDDADYPAALSYRYGADEPKVTGASGIEAWGVVTGVFSYDEQGGFESICPMIEVVYLTVGE